MDSVLGLEMPPRAVVRGAALAVFVHVTDVSGFGHLMAVENLSDVGVIFKVPELRA